jgi:hypothetical protein
MATVLKTVLRERFLQTYELFRDEYRKTAAKIDSQNDAPSRTQFHRWLSGDLKSLPHARHCRVLAEMFPEWSPHTLFLPAEQYANAKPPPATPASSGHRPSSATTEALRVVDAHTRISILVDSDGKAEVEYIYEIVNLTDHPVSRVPRAIWFKHVHSEIRIEPIQHGDHQVMIEMLHQAEPQKKFAYHLSPAIEPGESASYGCVIIGGLFVDEYFWRQSVLRDTDHMTMVATHRGQTLSRTWAIEELTDGSETLVSDQIRWRQDNGDLRLQLERSHLKPTQVVELTWETNEQCS